MLAALDIDAGGFPVEILAIGLGLIWLALVWWTYTDARLRLERRSMVALATAAALIPFVGTIIYMIVRPPEFLQDAYERKVSIESSEALLRTLADLQQKQAETHAAVKRLEQAMLASRRRALAARQAQAGAGTAARQQPSHHG